MKTKTDAEIQKMAEAYMHNKMKGFVGDFDLTPSYLEYAFEAGYKACQEEDRWIPVSERLPELNQMVLVYEPNDTIITAYYGEGYVYGKKQIGFHDGQDEQPGLISATHWMPLPSPPQLTNTKKA